ncbi:hypothetical protein IFR05_000662 [Cadophora sp. M221]|nr:hypothetical protein IFR05_000662 [Cadophora sp. M221]
MASERQPPRYPERSSSFSAIDFPHGPPNSPSSNMPSPDLMLLNTALTMVPDEDIPPLSLQDKKYITYKQEKEQEVTMVNELQRSLSKYVIKEPVVEEFAFEPMDAQVRSEAAEVETDSYRSPVARPATPLVPSWFGSRKGTDAAPQEDHGEVVEVEDHAEHESSEISLCLVVSNGASPPTPHDHQEAVSAEVDMVSAAEDVPLCLGSAVVASILSRDGYETPPTPMKPVGLPISEVSQQMDKGTAPLAKDYKENENPRLSTLQPVISDTPSCLALNENVIIKSHGENEKQGSITAVELPPAEVVKPMATITVVESPKDSTLAPGQLIPKKKTFVVAISGCSSAGKSVLAKILSTVFSTTSIIPDTNEASHHKKTIMISQDDFFQPKALQPLITFLSCPSDSHFMERSIQNDEQGMYFIAFSGTRPDHPPESLLICTNGSRHTQRTDSFDSTNSDASRAIEGGHRPRYQVTGPMTDCDQALNFVGLVEAINDVKSTGQLTDYTKRFYYEKDMDEFSILIGEMKEKVSGWIKEQVVLNAEARFGGCVVRGPIENDGKNGIADEGNGKETLRPQFVFVEGFLLLAPSAPSNNKKVFDVSAEKVKIEKYTTHLETLSAELLAKHNIDAEIEGERDVIESQLWATNLAAKNHLQGLFDVKLFLNTSKSEAKRRRFERVIYTDAPAGGRLPGQMWKSEGYFEEAVWKGFENGYSWLLKSEAVQGEGNNLATENGVFVEPVQDADIKVCVEWAVDVLLAEMGRLEAEARIAGGGCCIDD